MRLPSWRLLRFVEVVDLVMKLQVSMGGMPNSMQRQQALQRMGIDSSGANMASMMQQGGYQGTASNPMSGMGPQQGMMGNMGMQGMAMQGMGMQGRAMQGMGMGMGGGQSMSGPMARNMGGMMPSGGFLGKRGRMDEIRERRMAQGGQPLLKFLGSTAPALNSVGAAPPPGMRNTQSFPTQGQPVSNVNRQSPGSQQDRLGQQGGGHFIHSGGSGQQEQGYGTAGQQGPHYSGSEEQQPLNAPQSQGDLPAPQNHEDNEIILVSDEENEERQPAMNEQGETDAAQPAPASSAPIAEGSRNVPEGRDNHDGSGASAGPAESVIPAHQHEAPELVNDSQIVADEGAEQAGGEARASEGPQAEMPSEGAAVVDDNASAVSDTAKPTDIGPEDPTAQQPGPITATATPNTMPTSPNAAAQTVGASLCSASNYIPQDYVIHGLHVGVRISHTTGLTLTLCNCFRLRQSVQLQVGRLQMLTPWLLWQWLGAFENRLNFLPSPLQTRRSLLLRVRLIFSLPKFQCLKQVRMRNGRAIRRLQP
jgi:hypothetical protein